ncbi:MAG TPA: adenylate/guanylate cyclase domain-containing protein, partial [Candidatus Acidoferrum sp.]|nr:adenylate/guanylate cyclase domain-containing protein [Candidatus Acidoferrum sp.]
ELFGSRVPDLPEVQLAPDESDALFVDLHPSLAQALRDLIETIYQVLAEREGDKDASYDRRRMDSPFQRFEELLESILVTIIERERRLGLLNLFWLAHSKHAAGLVQDIFSRPGVKISIKYQIHPLLQGAYRNAFTRVWTRFKSQGGTTLVRNLGADFNPSLIDCIIDDQLPLTETSLARLNFATVLVENNKRFRISFREFKEIYAACRERLREGLQRKEPRLLEILRRVLPSIRPDQYDDERGATRILFNGRALAYLLGDLGDLGGRLVGSPILKAEVTARRGWSELLLDYQDLLQAVKRSEVVDLVRQPVILAGPAHTEVEQRERYDEGRLYRFHPGSEILKLARKITVLFADLRGFTQTSEGAVSEVELTERLYEVFDPLASIVEQYHGRIDKFTGDGVMITFGSARVTRQDELNALRTALAMQQMMADLRAGGRTRFEMGISVHTGRAQVAHFILDDQAMDRTVIGRNVNIAGRLSGSGKSHAAPFEDEEDRGKSGAG